MSDYVSIAEDAARVRALYKKRGWGRNEISVRAQSYSMGSSLHVRIKSPSVDFAEAERIARSAESIDRDQFGEILSGGNRFVEIGYTRECEQIIARRVLGALEEALAQNAPRGTGEPLSGFDHVFVYHDSPGWAHCSVDGDRAGPEFWTQNESGRMHGAFCLARHLEQRKPS